jgi:hypothetical protein
VTSKIFKNRCTEQVLAPGLSNGLPDNLFFNNLNRVHLPNAAHGHVTDARAQGLIVGQTSNHQRRSLNDLENYVGSVQNFVAPGFIKDNVQDAFSHTVNKIHPSTVTADCDSTGDRGTAVNLIRRVCNSQWPNIQDLEDYPLVSILDKEYSDQQYVIPLPQSLCTAVDTVITGNQVSAGIKVKSYDRTQYISPPLNNQGGHMLGGRHYADQTIPQQYVYQCKYGPAEAASALTHSSLQQSTSPSYDDLHGSSLSLELKKYQAMQSPYRLEYTSSSYNPWNPNTFPGCKNLIQHMNVATSNTHNSEVSTKTDRLNSSAYDAHIKSCPLFLHVQESSHESTLTSEDYLDSPTQSVNNQNQYRCVCILCRPAMWIVLPYAHEIMC